MRVIAGKYGSRPLQSFAGREIRPTSDRLRETLFNVLCAGNPMVLEGTIWLDLFAGTGAVGIEALSRGAREVFFVEASARAAELIQKNLATLGIKSGFRVVKMDTLAAVRKFKASGKVMDFIFLDPPYALKNAYQRTLTALAESSLIASSTVAVAEHERKFDPGRHFGTLRRYRKVEQGGWGLSFYRQAPQAASSCQLANS
ncbi:MAG: 16S rRNA (guanine(966)-N(2))-methyltransferase RsmD [Acidobacteria bacterium]|nr:16S rRNA (guanine(966)-N(2))-methyltransferase RsmD [Acidobacteriota bacterium]